MKLDELKRRREALVLPEPRTSPLRLVEAAIDDLIADGQSALDAYEAELAVCSEEVGAHLAQLASVQRSGLDDGYEVAQNAADSTLKAYRKRVANERWASQRKVAWALLCVPALLIVAERLYDFATAGGSGITPGFVWALAAAQIALAAGYRFLHTRGWPLVRSALVAGAATWLLHPLLFALWPLVAALGMYLRWVLADRAAQQDPTKD